MEKETIFQVFLTKLFFWNLWSFWGHHWDLWRWSQRWFSSSLTKIPHNVGFLPGWIQHCEEFFKNFSNPALWGILKLFKYSSQSWIFEILEDSDDTFEIFVNDANDDFDQAWQKFLTMLHFNSVVCNIVRNFPKSLEILHCEEVLNEKRDNSSQCWIFVKSLKLLMASLRYLTLMPMMILIKLDKNSPQC